MQSKTAPSVDWLDDGIPRTTAALYETVLGWTSEDISREDLLHAKVRKLPLLPVLGDGVEAYHDGFKLAILAELHAGLNQAVFHPNQQSRRVETHKIEHLDSRSKEGVTTTAACMIRIQTAQRDWARPMDLIILSGSNHSPFEYSSGLEAIGIIRKVDRLGEDRMQEKPFVHVEILRDSSDSIDRKYEGKSLHMTVVASVASSVRVFQRLEIPMLPRHLEQLVAGLDGDQPVIDRTLNVRHAGLLSRVARTYKKLLNPAQQSVVLDGLRLCDEGHSGLPIVIGPPGTGKTHTLISLLLSIMTGYPEMTVHVVAPSNKAIQELARRLGSSIVSKGSDGMIRAESLARVCLIARDEDVEGDDTLQLLSYHRRESRLKKLHGKWAQTLLDLDSFDNLAAADDDQAAPSSLDAIHQKKKEVCKKAIAVLRTLRYDMDDVFKDQAEVLDTASDLLAQWVDRNPFPRPGAVRAPKIDQAFNMLRTGSWAQLSGREDWAGSVISRATIFFSTINGASSHPLRELHARSRLIIVDEATQCTEAEINIVLRGKIRGPMLVGDDQQLSSTVLTAPLSNKNFRMSLFERLKIKGVRTQLLDIQYRMKPEIAQWPSERFYDKGILNGPNVTSSAWNPSWQRLPGPFRVPYQVIHVPALETADEGGRSKSNSKEADVACALIKDLAILLDLSQDEVITVGIIAGYTAQVQLVASKLRNLTIRDTDVDPTKGLSFRYGTPGGKVLLLDIASVDSFQGAQREVILFLTTRSNIAGQLGFMADPRRLNVAITRSQFCLRILLNSDTVETNGVWKSLTGDARDRGILKRAEHLFANLFSADHTLALSLMRPSVSDAIRKPTNSAEEHPHRPARALPQSSTDCVGHASLKSTGASLPKDLGLLWAVFFSAHCKTTLERSTQSTAHQLVRIAKGLAAGFQEKHLRKIVIRVREEPFVYECMTSDDRSLFFSIKMMPEPSQEPGKRIFRQGIWLWLISEKRTRKRDLTSVAKIVERLGDEYLALCSERIWSGDSRPRAQPVCRTLDHELLEYGAGIGQLEAVVEGHDDVARQDDGDEMIGNFEAMDLVKGFHFDTRVSEAALSGALASLTLPFVLSSPETDLVYARRPCFVLGRSGTGKTTVMVLRMYAKAEAAKPQGCKQLLVTASPHLAAGIKQHYDSLTASDREERAAQLTFSEDLFAEDEPLRSLADISMAEFPLFLTLSQLLRSLDTAIPGGPFYGFDASSVSKRIEVDFARWVNMYWARMPEHLQKRSSDGASTYAEIVSVIKGSSDAVHAGRALTQKEYLAFPATRSTKLNDQERADVYEAYVKYRLLLGQNGDWDSGDALLSIHARLAVNPGLLPSFAVETLAIDEIQDMTESAQLLLKYLLSGQDAHTGVFFAGDTAQSIASGVNFKFSSLRRMFHDAYLPHCRKSDPLLDARMQAQPGLHGQLVPRISHLTTNYRSSKSIISLGAAIVDLVVELFPAGIDKLEKEDGLVDGVRPLWLATQSIAEFMRITFGPLEENRQSTSEFGAGQVIICRNAESKAELKSIVQNAIVLTVQEVKGLEYDDVILYDFCRHSLFDRWHILSNAGERGTFDSKRDAALETELKMLYVAVTRARKNLWIFDRDERSRWLRDMLVERNLVTLLDRQPVQPFAKKSTPAEWLSRGQTYFSVKNFADAMFAFQCAGEQDLADEAQAFLLLQSAQIQEGLDKPKLAAACFAEAAGAFLLIRRYWKAAECYQSCARYSGDGRKFAEAARMYAKCPDRAEAGKWMLLCYKEAPKEYLDEYFFATRTTEWLDKDSHYYEAVQDIVYRFDDAGRKEGVRDAAKLLEASADRIELLETLGAEYHDLVDLELNESGSHERLACVQETRFAVKKAVEQWRRAGKSDRAEALEAAASRAKEIIPTIQKVAHLRDNYLCGISKSARSHLPIGKLEDFRTCLQTNRKGDGLMRAILLGKTGLPPTRKVQPPMNDLWNAVEEVLLVCKEFLDLRRSIVDSAWLTEAVHADLGTIADLGGRREPTMRRVIWRQICADVGSIIEQEAGWMEVKESDLCEAYRLFLDEAFHAGTDLLTTTLHNALDRTTLCPEASLGFEACAQKNTGGTVICVQTHDMKFHRLERSRRLQRLSEVLHLTSRWPARTAGDGGADQSFDLALGLLIRELWPIDPVLADHAFAHKWMTQQDSNDVFVDIHNNLRARSTQPSLHVALHVAQLSTACASTLVFLRTDEAAHIALEQALLLSRYSTITTGANPLYNAAVKACDIFFTKDFWPRSIDTPGARIFVLEKAISWISILINRMHSLVLPERLVQTELCDASRYAVGALMRRGFHGALDWRSYHRDIELIRLRNELIIGITNRLGNADLMEEFSETTSHGQRNGLVVRLVICAGLLMMNVPRQSADFGFSLWSRLPGMIRGLTKDARFSGLPAPIIAIATLPMERTSREAVCSLIASLANYVNDPLFMIIDPQVHTGRLGPSGTPLIPHDLRRAGMAKLYAALSDQETLVLCKDLPGLTTAAKANDGWSPYGNLATGRRRAATKLFAKEQSLKPAGSSIVSPNQPRAVKLAVSRDSGADSKAALASVSVVDRPADSLMEGIIVQDIQVEQEVLPEPELTASSKLMLRRWLHLVRSHLKPNMDLSPRNRKLLEAFHELRRMGVVETRLRARFTATAVPLILSAHNLVNEVQEVQALFKENKKKGQDMLTGAGHKGSASKALADLTKAGKALDATAGKLSLKALNACPAGLTVEALVQAIDLLQAGLEKTESDHGLILKAFRRKMEKGKA